MTGQPDFATIRVEYVPDEKVVESKSFKLYLWSYRNEGAFHEHVVNQILDDLVKILDPALVPGQRDVSISAAGSASPSRPSTPKPRGAPAVAWAERSATGG